MEKKGVEYLLRACGILKDLGLIPSLRVVGDGPLMPSLKELAAGLDLGREVEFVGAVSTEALHGLYAPDTILVQPSVYASDGERDGIPTVIVEAMAVGTPVIATRVSGIPEIVSHNETGLLVDEKDPKALASAILHLHDDGKLCLRLKKNARAKVELEYDIRLTTGKVRSLISKSAGKI